MRSEVGLGRDTRYNVLLGGGRYKVKHINNMFYSLPNIYPQLHPDMKSLGKIAKLLMNGCCLQCLTYICVSFDNFFAFHML